MKKLSVYLISLVALVALVCNPYGYNAFELPKAHFLVIFSAITVIAVMAHFIMGEGVGFSYNKYVLILLGIWTASLILSTVFSITPQLSFWGSSYRLQGLYTHLTYLVLFVIFLNSLRDKESQEIFLKMTLGIGTIVAIHAILQQLGMGTFGEDSMNITVGRSFSTLGNPNFMAQFLIFPLWAGMYFVAKNKGEKRLMYVILVLLIAGGILFSKSRASMLGIVISAGLLTVFLLRIKRIYKYIFVLAMFSAFVLFVVFIATNMQSLMARFYIWKGTFGIIKDHWFIGSGLETFKTVFQKVQPKELMAVEEAYALADRAHNGILDLLVSQGIVGLLAYVSIIIGIFYKILRKIKEGGFILWAMMAALLSAIISNLFSFYMTTDYVMLMAVIAIILNCTTEFKIVNLKGTIFRVFIAGMIFALSCVSIFWAGRAIYADTICYRGIGKIEESKIQEGMEDIVHAVNLNMPQSGATIVLIKAFEGIGEDGANKGILNQADQILDEYSKISGKDFQYYFEKGEVATGLQNFDLANEYYGKAQELAPNQPSIMRQWGIMLYEKGDFQGAITKIEQFLDVIPQYWKWKNTTETLSYSDKEKFRLFFKEKPEFWEVFEYLSDSYAKVGDKVKAEYYEGFVEE
ncbi:MAG: O-antigen ligase family protein [Candidatus Gracilibacteria bacterium]|jgi:putative inorganic carbon (HCO3(-)) transporter